MTDDPEQLGQHDADDLHAVRHLDPGQLLDRQDVGQVVHHPAEIIDAIGVGDVGVPGLTLAHFLGAAMVIADVGNGIDDVLAVELQHDPKHAVHARMIGAEVEEHELVCFAVAREAPTARA